ncbi:MAG: chemotaxis protein CheW [Pseudobdellovibrionaceae bacterium]|jgi:purine-binding chemotaxis protein CheW
MTQESRYLCFNLGVEEFALPLLTVREVLAIPETTPVPQMPPYFKGILNLRGKIISIMDLRVKLNIKTDQPSDENAVVILDLGEYSLGIVVDRVNAVLTFEAEGMSEKPLLENSKNSEFITGVYRKNDKLILLINVLKALSLEDRMFAQPTSKKTA